MKKILLALAFIGCMFAAHAQEKPSTGDLYDGLTRPLTFNRVIPPYALEVTFSKTVHVIFPSAIRYVDLGSSDLLAAKADGTENVLRVKAALRDFSRESNLSVITEDGAYYSFNVKYADEPVKLSVEMADFLHDGEAVNRPNNALDIYLQELGCESPLLVKLIMQSIYKNDRREIKHIGCKRFGVQYLLKGIYVHNDLLYFHLQLKNSSNVPFNVDYLTFKITDKKVAKRTAIQEQVVWPVRAYNNVQVIGGKRTERMVFTLPKFTLADDKQLVVELHEQQGGRHQTFTVENADLVRARVINELKVKLYETGDIHSHAGVMPPPFGRGARPACPARHARAGNTGRHGRRLLYPGQPQRNGLLVRAGHEPLREECRQVGVRRGVPEPLLPLQVGTYPCGAVHGRGRLLLQVPRRPVQDFFLLPRRLGAGRLRECEPGREAAL